MDKPKPAAERLQHLEGRTMTTRWGTSHFETLAAAEKYYRAYGVTKDNVGRKVAEGEIHIGPPKAKAGQTVTLNHEEGRYFIEEKPNRQDNCDGSGPHQPGDVRVLPTGGDGNLILCRNCYEREIRYRVERNRDLGDFAKFALPAWEALKIYGLE